MQLQTNICQDSTCSWTMLSAFRCWSKAQQRLHLFGVQIPAFSCSNTYEQPLLSVAHSRHKSKFFALPQNVWFGHTLVISKHYGNMCWSGSCLCSWGRCGWACWSTSLHGLVMNCWHQHLLNQAVKPDAEHCNLSKGLQNLANSNWTVICSVTRTGSKTHYRVTQNLALKPSDCIVPVIS